MDPKSLSNLDPKLRETYERVMGTSATPSISKTSPQTTSIPVAGAASSKPASNPTPPSPASAPTNTITNTSPNSGTIPFIVNNPTPSQPTNPTPILTNQPIQITDAPKEAIVLTTPTPQANKPLQPLPSPASINSNVAAQKHSSPVITSLYIIAFIIFFAVYAVFWLKIFKYPLPFLPAF